MARLKGRPVKRTTKEAAKNKMRIVMMILIFATVFNCGRMVINAIAGMVGKTAVIEQYGGEEKMAELSDAELQRPYYVCVNERVGKARTPIGKGYEFLNNLGCLALLWKTCQWHWGFKATVRFTIALFWELIFLAICVPLYLRWRKIATAKPERKKTKVDIIKEMNQQEQDKVEKERLEAIEREKHKGDPNWMTPEEFTAVNERLMTQRRIEKWQSKK